MSSLIVPAWPSARPLSDDRSFRSWLKGVASPSGPDLGGREKKLNPVIVPIAVQAELSRGANEMLAEALAAGPEHLPQRMSVVSERISECLELSDSTGKTLLKDLRSRILSPVDVEDLYQLSRSLNSGTAKLGTIASTMSMFSATEAGLHPIHVTVQSSLEVVSRALNHLNDRERSYTAIQQLFQYQTAARQFCRDYFARRMPAITAPVEMFSAVAARHSYDSLITHLGSLSSAIYRTALKNG